MTRQLSPSAERMPDAPLTRLNQAPAATTTRWDLIAAASHDLRTPISSIGLMIDAIADDLVDDVTTRRYYEQIRKQLRSMTALTDDLIVIGRLKSDHLPSRQILDVSELISDALDTMAPLAGQHGVKLRAEVSPRLKPISADPEQLLRVLLNLITNAIRHSPPGETVLVAAAEGGDVVRLEVSDSGPGVSPGEREEVFKPFTCGTGHGTRPGTAGLGLAITRAIIEQHGGRIWIGPSLRGARFCMEIPAGNLPRGQSTRPLRPLIPAAA